jgi:rod shape determining protein RodA
MAIATGTRTRTRSAGPRAPVASLRSNPASPWHHIDVALLGATLAVALLGLMMIYSATKGGLAADGLSTLTYVKRQGLFFFGGLGLMGLATLLDYRWIRDMSVFLYGGVVLLLLAVLSPLGTTVRGAQSWFAVGPFQLQPAEFGKVALILLLGMYCAQHRGDLDFRRLVAALGIFAVPAGLIMLQPDLGSTLVYVAITMGVLLVAGARPKQILAVTAAGVVVVSLALAVGVLQLEDYQKDRLTSFASNGGDERGAAYNQEQSKIAVANGGWFGQGIGNGTQTRLQFVPEQQTDFIFTVVGEELGFVGSATLLLLYAAMGWRIWHAARVAKDMFGTLLCAGVLAMLVFQVFESVGMAMGIMPVTGIPLPFLSYGGSSLLTMFTAIGLVLNVHMRRFS